MDKAAASCKLYWLILLPQQWTEQLMQWRLGNVGIRGFAPLLSLSYLSSRCMFDDQWWFFRKPGTVLLFICTPIRFMKFLHALYTVDLLCFSLCSVLYCRDLAKGFVSLSQCTHRRQKPPSQSGVISFTVSCRSPYIWNKLQRIFKIPVFKQQTPLK